MASHELDRPFVCEQCSRSFVRKSDMTKHMRTHDHNTGHICTVCDKKLSNEFSLRRHEKKVHENRKKYNCYECEKQFLSRDALEEHTRKLHTKEKPYKCEQCLRMFVWKQSYERHKKTHSEVHPFSCESCSGSFATQQILQKHLRETHNGRVKFYCRLCSMTFNRGPDLRRHMDSHMKTTEGSKICRCLKCREEFTTEKELEEHSVTHITPKELEKLIISDVIFIDENNREINEATMAKYAQMIPPGILLRTVDAESKSSTDSLQHISNINGPSTSTYQKYNRSDDQSLSPDLGSGNKNTDSSVELSGDEKYGEPFVMLDINDIPTERDKEAKSNSNKGHLCTQDPDSGVHMSRNDVLDRFNLQKGMTNIPPLDNIRHENTKSSAHFAADKPSTAPAGEIEEPQRPILDLAGMEEKKSEKPIDDGVIKSLVTRTVKTSHGVSKKPARIIRPDFKSFPELDDESKDETQLKMDINNTREVSSVYLYIVYLYTTLFIKSAYER